MTESSKEYVERVFPKAMGSLKAALILAHGHGFDAGMAEAQVMIAEEMLIWAQGNGHKPR